MALRLKWIVVTICLFSHNWAFSLADTDPVDFEKKQVTLISGNVTQKITAEIARTESQHQRGLMFRKSLPKKHGMLFVFDDEMIRSFWMKNTIIDLSIGYFNKERKLIDVQEMKAVSSILQTEIPSYPSRGLAQYALEMPANWFKQNKIKEGATFKIESEKD